MSRELPADVAVYQQPSYWDQRFTEEEQYEWFKDYSHFRHLILQHVHPSDRVLELGCGNSRLSMDMFHDGITEVTCSDLSPIAVQKMKTRLEAENCKGVAVAVADMLDLPFKDNSFDVVIEKGTMDVLFVNSGDPWNPNLETKKSVALMLESVHRVLSPNGLFISISFTQPHFRRLVFESDRYSWSMNWATFGDTFHYFVYTLRKGTFEKRLESSSRRLQLDLVQEQMNQEDYLLQVLLDES
ncbi:hypothetical protein GOP47_0027109 [Adiantum capillus-veneris]|nr:hypothetical protein GOP47_0027109 [Adiantum capillus-veneris]